MNGQLIICVTDNVYRPVKVLNLKFKLSIMKMKSLIPCSAYLVMLVILFVSSQAAQSQSCKLISFQSVSIKLSQSKCGYESPLDPTSDHIDHAFLSEEVIDSINIKSYNNFLLAESGTLNSDVHVETNPTNCIPKLDSSSGNVIIDYGTSTTLAGPADVDRYGDVLWNATNIASGVITEYGFGAVCHGNPLLYDLCFNPDNTTSTKTLNQEIDVSTHNNNDLIDGDYDDDSRTYTTILSQPYTDELLAQVINANITMPIYPSGWNDGDPTSTASWSLDPAHLTGTGKKMQYRVTISHSIRGATYTCQWDRIVTDANGVAGPPQKKRGTVIGTGDPENPALGDIETEPVPTSPSTVIEENPVVISINLPNTPAEAAGNGGVN
jgi:hypothetical protein